MNPDAENPAMHRTDSHSADSHRADSHSADPLTDAHGEQAQLAQQRIAQRELVHQIVAGIGRRAKQSAFLDQGSTSAVWHVETDAAPLVVRLAVPHAGKTACFEGEAGLRAQLFQIDRRVAQPIASNFTHPTMTAATMMTAGTTVTADVLAWCVDSFVAGETLTRGALPPAVCHDVGQLLAGLHTLPAAGYGLLVDRRDKLVGQAHTVVDGLRTRLQDPWPFHPTDLRHHPIAQAAPHLLPRLAPYEDDLLALIQDAPSVPLHTDLHERQMPSVGGRLNGLLDFGDAMIGPVVCDIGSFMGFHGRAQTQWLLEGYTDHLARRQELLAQAHLWSIVTSLHHASRAITLNSAGRMRRVLRFLEENLASS